MTATNNDSDGHNRDNQLSELSYPTMLNELNCTFGISFHVFIAVAVMVMVCGHHGIGCYSDCDRLHHYYTM